MLKFGRLRPLVHAFTAFAIANWALGIPSSVGNRSMANVSKVTLVSGNRKSECGELLLLASINFCSKSIARGITGTFSKTAVLYINIRYSNDQVRTTAVIIKWSTLIKTSDNLLQSFTGLLT